MSADGSQSPSPSPDIAAGYGHTCILTKAGGVLCWGHNGFGQLASEDFGDWKSVLLADVPGEVTAVAAGAYHTCILVKEGRVYCWGWNSFGQLGDGTNQDRSSPVRVKSLPDDIIQLDAGSTHTCALDAEGAVYCWGQNTCGQLGDGTELDRSEAVPVREAPAGVVAIAAGGVFTCSLTGTGEIFCWGDGSSDRFPTSGEGCGLRPVKVAVGQRVRALAAGEYHLCAILEDDSVACWGSVTTERATTPENPLLVTGLPDGIAMLEAGAGFQCALTHSGAVFCWGDDYFGQLGDGMDAASLSPMPVDEVGGRGLMIAAGSGHACALIDDGGVRCWGDASAGQLGDGSQRWK